MPNLNCEIQIPKGHFFTCDIGVAYNQIPFHQPTFNTVNLTIHCGNINNEQYFKISNQNGETICLLRLVIVNILNRDFFKVSKIGTLPAYRRNGYAYHLYRLAIERLEFPIICDTTLTIPGSYNIWIKLIRDSKAGDIQVKSIDTRKNTIVQYSYKNPKIRTWGFDSELLNIIKEDKENLEEAYKEEDISKELYEFLKSNMRHIGDKIHIRITAEKV